MNSNSGLTLTIEMINDAIYKVENANKVQLKGLREFLSHNQTKAIATFTAIAAADSLDERYHHISSKFPQFMDHAHHLIETSILLG
ncbi:hypothetical protein [Vibrio paucivorans]|uniref:Uncharacterized protein n=1 Tax=Vibrio paucivorans TaxID=2829489 RepID=A0A9X3HU20_9VIBR|nr:hypothetical protein [Vibrio paucivorans]MCW8336174.1 hypothetical protein [Vibrio paucivorans]